MPITNAGRTNAFNEGLINKLNLVKVKGNGIEVDYSSATFSHDAQNSGRCVSDAPLEFSVTAGDTVDEVVLQYGVSGSTTDIWVISVSPAYTFQYDGTFTLEDLWVQFTGPSDPATNGGITEIGREYLATTGLSGTEMFSFGSSDFITNGSSSSPATSIDGSNVNWTVDSNTLKLTEGLRLNAVQLQPDTGKTLLPTASQITIGVFDGAAFYINFTEKSFQYPGPLTIEEITVTIV